MSTATKARRGGTDRYLELVMRFPLRPIRTKAEYKRATEFIDQFATASEGSLPTGDADYFGILTMLIEDYDARHAPVDTLKVDPISVLKHLMEEYGMTSGDLGKLIGSKGVASEVLNAKRSLSKSHMGTLAEHFAVDVSVFFPVRHARR